MLVLIFHISQMKRHTPIFQLSWKTIVCIGLKERGEKGKEKQGVSKLAWSSGKRELKVRGSKRKVATKLEKKGCIQGED